MARLIVAALVCIALQASAPVRAGDPIAALTTCDGVHAAAPTVDGLGAAALPPPVVAPLPLAWSALSQPPPASVAGPHSPPRGVRLLC
jgi:hypothetical protein